MKRRRPLIKTHLLPLPVSATLFSTFQTSIANVSAALGVLKALGPGATVAMGGPRR